MERYFQRFISSDSGSALADRMMLAAGVLMLGVAVFGTLRAGDTERAATTISIPVVVTSVI